MELDELLQRIEPPSVAAASPLDWWRAVRLPGPVCQLRATADSWDAGVQDVDAAVDAGATVLLLVQAQPATLLARALCALFCGTDATAVVPTCATDLAWMRECATIRDAMPQARGRLDHLPALLMEDASLAWTTAAILQAAARRTPVLASGALVSLATLCVERLAPAAAAWLEVGLADDDPAGLVARDRLGRQPWVTSRVVLSPSAQSELLRTAAAALDDQR